MQLIGLARLGRDAEAPRTAGSTVVCNLSLAFNYGQKAQDGNRPTQWVDASLWGKQAEALYQHLQKGKLVCVTLDDVHIETFEGKSGPGQKLVGKVSKLDFASPKSEQADAPRDATPAPRNEYAPARGVSQPAPQTTGAAGRGGATGFDDMDDDLIPF
jgi:single-strand DNA-binding protein